jgi:hypothetical protein
VHYKEYNIKVDLKETEWKSVDWIDLAKDRHKWRDIVNKDRDKILGFIKCGGIS